MPDPIELKINGARFAVERGCTVAVAIAMANLPCRTSITGEKRGPLCGMGICFECRATVNGTAQTRTCQLLCEPAMDIHTS
jgi:aerobic-type carbon monoxide dehydrogenase small subunit (CoxS/CutS family)